MPVRLLASAVLALAFIVRPAAAATLASLPLRQAAQAADTTREPLLVELQVGRVTAFTVPAYRAADTLFLPVAPFLRAAGIRHEIQADASIAGTLQPGDTSFAIPVASDTIHAGRRRIHIPPGARVVADGELYLSTEVLSRLLSITFVVSWTDLVVRVADPEGLPTGARERRSARHAGQLARASRSADGAPDAVLPLERPALDGLVLDYSLGVPSDQPLRGATYQAALGANVYGGSLHLMHANSGGSAGATRTEGSWTGIWRDQPWLRQVTLGDGLTTGPRLRAIRGVALTNSPFLRPTRFGLTDLIGIAPPGWEVEVYRSGQLMMVDTISDAGRVLLRVPLEYGDNAVTLLEYGPHGEIRRVTRTVPVDQNLLPAGQFEYGLSGGACGRPECETGGNLDLRYGVTRRWTVRTGVDRYERDTLPRLVHPYASVSGLLWNSVAAELEAVGDALTRAAVRYQPSLHLRATAGYTHYDGGTRAPLFSPPDARSLLVLSAFVRPGERESAPYIETLLEHETRDVGNRTRARFGAAIQSHSLRTLPYARLERDHSAAGVERRSFVGLDAFAWSSAELPAWLRGIWLRANVESETRGRLETATLAATRSLRPGLQLQMQGSWRRDAPGVVMTIGVTTDHPQFRASSVATLTRDRSHAVQFAQGSVLWNRPSGRVVLTHGPSMLRSGVTGRVFLDENGNGVLDDGETPIGGAGVRIGADAARTDSTGWFQLWDLLPFEPSPLQVDSMTFTSPLWVPGRARVSLMLGPNRFNRVDVPIAPGGTVDGRVTRDGLRGPEPLAGATVLLTNVATGEQQRLRTFSDGVFTAFGIRPGDYEIRVDPAELAILDATSAGQRFSLPASRDGAVVDGIELRVIRRAPDGDR